MKDKEKNLKITLTKLRIEARSKITISKHVHTADFSLVSNN